MTAENTANASETGINSSATATGIASNTIDVDNEILHYEKITFRRDGRPILKGVNWHVKRGENWALLGLYGAGKSTMLSMIPAYQIPTTGILRVFGHEFGKYAWVKIKNRLGFVSSTLSQFQSTLNKQTVEDVVISGRYNTIGIYQVVEPEVRRKAQDLMGKFQITHLGNHHFRTLSQGEQRRTLLARAIMSEPDLLILDEPCSGLDLPARESFLHTVESLGVEHNTPYIYVSHQIEEIMPSITHVALLRDGEMAYQGKKEDILTDEILSDLFDMPVHVVWERDRPWVIVR